jgi:phosphoribosyl-ATP pyrophosphohydrolase/phosphoribosyl-AMP cyclohydrolase
MNIDMMDMERIQFNEKGLVPAIVQDAETGKVLMMAWMNRESLQRTRETGWAHFYSRSRQALWMKGETSGNRQRVLSVQADCDGDTLLLKVKKEGPACHTGSETCFGVPLWEEDEAAPFSLDSLMATILGRKNQPKEGSYTTYLFEKGLDKILKKVGEESTEVIIAAKGGDRGETVYEIADLVYHMLVLMVQAGISLDDIKQELAGRHVIDHKEKQQSMKGK